MSNTIIDFVKELFTPSNLEKETKANIAYRRAMVYVFHFCLGGAYLVSLLWLGVPLFVAFGIITFLAVAKEVIDIRTGGTYRDALEDAVSTLAGAFFQTVGVAILAFPLIAIVLSAIVIASELLYTRKKRP